MRISVGTFNLNNLFSRFNFSGVVEGSPNKDGGITLSFDEDERKVRTYRGRLVKGKKAAETRKIADRILAMDCDVLGVQEVEHIGILKEFNSNYLNGLYPHIALVEGNDSRLIDVGFMSKLPLGAITSHQAARHPDELGKRVFGRDLLEVEILDQNRNRLLTIYNSHKKSHFVPNDQDPLEGKEKADKRRRQQSEVTSEIISSRQRVGAKFILLGDMNDPPDSPHLAPMLTVDGVSMVSGLANAIETRPAKAETSGQGPGPQTTNWTHRYNPEGPEPPHYEQYDQIWLSDALAPGLISAHIDRRKNHGGDGSDHDPAWVVLEI